MNKTLTIILCLSAIVLIAYLLASSPTGKEELSKVEEELRKLKAKVKDLGGDATTEIKKKLSSLEDQVNILREKF